METQSDIATSVPEELEINRRAWNIVAPKFAGGCALPHWGPFGEGRSLDLLGPLKGATVLEAGCGSGHSIGRVLELGAKLVYGIDFSSRQIAMAADLNRMQIDSGCVRLIEAPMEEPLGLKDIDVIFSIQALGWTRDPAATFGNFASYLKPGGRLVWSWGHPLFHKVHYQEGKLVLNDSYFNEQSQFAVGWSGSDGAIIQTRTIATWFRYLRNAGFIVREYLELEAEILPDSARDPYRYYSEVKARAVPGTIVFICERG
jgi:SAM-dependent methyltransferase